MSKFVSMPDKFGDCVEAFVPDDPWCVVVVGADDSEGAAYCGAGLDREGAVALIEALTAAVEAADTREAAEARKLKRGDVVRLTTNHTWIYTVLSDEDSDGRADLVCLSRWGQPAGDLLNDPAEDFERFDHAGA